MVDSSYFDRYENISQKFNYMVGESLQSSDLSSSRKRKRGEEKFFDENFSSLETTENKYHDLYIEMLIKFDSTTEDISLTYEASTDLENDKSVSGSPRYSESQHFDTDLLGDEEHSLPEEDTEFIRQEVKKAFHKLKSRYPKIRKNTLRNGLDKLFSRTVKDLEREIQRTSNKKYVIPEQPFLNVYRIGLKRWRNEPDLRKRLGQKIFVMSKLLKYYDKNQEDLLDIEYLDLLHCHPTLSKEKWISLLHKYHHALSKEELYMKTIHPFCKEENPFIDQEEEDAFYYFCENYNKE